MSVRRKDSSSSMSRQSRLSSLSSLTKAWSIEDEEEVERERRRRNRLQSASIDEDVASGPTPNGDQQPPHRLLSVEEEEPPTSPPAASKNEAEEFQSISRTRQERQQRRQVVEGAQAPVHEQPEAEKRWSGAGLGQAKQQPPVPKKEVEKPLPCRLSQERRGPWIKEEEHSASREPGEGKKRVSEKVLSPEKSPVSEKSFIPERTLSPEKRLASEETSKKGLAPEKMSVKEKIAASEKRSTSEEKSIVVKRSVSEKSPALGKILGAGGRVSAISQMFDKPQVSQETPATRTKPTPKRVAASEQPQTPEHPRAPEQAGSGGRPTITKQRGQAPPEEKPPCSAEEGEQRPSRLPTSHFKPITLEVKIPSQQEEEGDMISPTQATYSSSLQRSSPRTLSFRMNFKEDNIEKPLTRSASSKNPSRSASFKDPSRSASVKVPSNTNKFGDRLGRYNSAVQRSESVKYPASSRTEFIVAPSTVASKRHLFEKEMNGQSQAETASSLKEKLKLPGVVTSKINLWISRTQGPEEQDPQV
ncbi:ladinin-1 isoform X5 [Talpa occidentalis]|uniref:ladinin-1 isoform X5 n=1 Tax=Talpa occidentalis TaxID=50954 RepID=UPI00188E4C5D|nr:ladinin-1 isoform X5 [Talpa occidentalis]